MRRKNSKKSIRKISAVLLAAVIFLALSAQSLALGSTGGGETPQLNPVEPSDQTTAPPEANQTDHQALPSDDHSMTQEPVQTNPPNEETPPVSPSPAPTGAPVANAEESPSPDPLPSLVSNASIIGEISYAGETVSEAAVSVKLQQYLNEQWIDISEVRTIQDNEKYIFQVNSLPEGSYQVIVDAQSAPTQSWKLIDPSNGANETRAEPSCPQFALDGNNSIQLYCELSDTVAESIPVPDNDKTVDLPAEDNATGSSAPRAVTATIQAAQLPAPSPTSVKITGTLGLTGLLNTGVTLTYSTSPSFTSPTVITLASGNGTDDGTYSLSQYTKTLTGLTPNTLYYIKVEATILLIIQGTASTNFTTIPTVPVISSLVSSSTAGTSAAISSTFSAGGNAVISSVKVLYSTSSSMSSPTAFTVPAGSGSGQYTASGFSNFPVTGLTRGSTYYFQVQETNAGGTASSAVKQLTITSTALSVSLPSSLLFAAFQSDGGTVKSPTFAITNLSDASISVQLRQVNTVNADSINFVQTAANPGDLRLDVNGTAGTGFQSFSMSGVNPSGTVFGSSGNMGTLGGTVLNTSVAQTGKFNLSGQYVGGFYTSTTYKKPQLSFVFRFNLLSSED